MLLHHRTRGRSLARSRALADLVRSVAPADRRDRVFFCDVPVVADFDGATRAAEYRVATVEDAARAVNGRLDIHLSADIRRRLDALPDGHVLVYAAGLPHLVSIAELDQLHPPAAPAQPKDPR